MYKLVRHRLTIDVTEEQQRKLDKYFPHGERQRFFSLLLDDLLDTLDKYGGAILGAYVRRRLSLTDISPMIRKGKGEENES